MLHSQEVHGPAALLGRRHSWESGSGGGVWPGYIIHVFNTYYLIRCGV